MTKKRTPAPETPENRDDPARPSAPPPTLPWHGDASLGLPEDPDERRAAMEALGNLDADPKSADWLRPWVREGYDSYQDWAADQGEDQ